MKSDLFNSKLQALSPDPLVIYKVFAMQIPARPALLLSLALVLPGLMSACKPQTAPTTLPKTVKLMRVEASGAEDAQAQNGQDSFSGEVKAQVESALSFRVGGKLIRRPVELGQSVARGQVLAEMDPSDYQLSAQAAVAQVQAAQTARDLAAADVQRFESLRQQGFISGAQLEQLQAQLKSAQAQLAQARAQAAVQGNQVGYSHLRADSAGVVTAVMAEPGQVLGAGQTVLQLAHAGGRDVVFALPENLYGSLRVGTPVRISSWTASSAEAEKEWPGRIREIAASADPITRTFSVKASIQAPEASAPALGSTVKVWPQLASTHSGSISLPLSALSQHGDETLVWVYTPQEGGGVVQPRAVTTAEIAGNTVRITAGLKAGEQIVAAGTHVLTAGQSVRPYQGKPGSPSAIEAAAALKADAAAGPAAADAIDATNSAAKE